MSRKDSYICQNCGAIHSKWAGKCEQCGEWNCIEEQKNSISKKGGKPISITKLGESRTEENSLISDIAELDRVCGGRIIKGSAILLGGEPGIGKSTLMLQFANALSQKGERVLYVSGEESLAQVQMRAERLGISNSEIEMAAETNIEDIITTCRHNKNPSLLIIDSVQTVWSKDIDSPPGTITQLRNSTHRLIEFAKANNIILLLIGHVTKEGQIAGPRIIEHMVDTVLYFEGDKGNQFRLVRAVKNRFGAAHEIGVFEMTAKGLLEISNPSALFLSEHEEPCPGMVVFAGMEGTRPLLVEIQALAAPSTLATPRRAVIGWDSARLSMILAVLEAHCGVNFAQRDVFLNVAGGFRIQEPAADLAVATALLSSLSKKPLAKGSIVFGEISLSGAVRPVGHAPTRLKEATKLGFQHALTPIFSKMPTSKMKIKMIEDVASLLLELEAVPPRHESRRRHIQ